MPLPPLEQLDAYRDDAKSSYRVSFIHQVDMGMFPDGCVFQFYSYPQFFYEQWSELIDREVEMKRQKKKKQHQNQSGAEGSETPVQEMKSKQDGGRGNEKAIGSVPNPQQSSFVNGSTASGLDVDPVPLIDGATVSFSDMLQVPPLSSLEPAVDTKSPGVTKRKMSVNRPDQFLATVQEAPSSPEQQKILHRLSLTGVPVIPGLAGANGGVALPRSRRSSVMEQGTNGEAAGGRRLSMAAAGVTAPTIYDEATYANPPSPKPPALGTLYDESTIVNGVPPFPGPVPVVPAVASIATQDALGDVAPPTPLQLRGYMAAAVHQRRKSTQRAQSTVSKGSDPEVRPVSTVVSRMSSRVTTEESPQRLSMMMADDGGKTVHRRESSAGSPKIVAPPPPRTLFSRFMVESHFLSCSCPSSTTSHVFHSSYCIV